MITLFACSLTDWVPVASTLIGILVGGLLGHYLARSRDTEAREAILAKEADIRRRSFKKFLYCFRGRIERISHEDDGAVWAEYTKLAPDFKGEAAMVGGDFDDRETFAKLADNVSNWRHADVKKEAENRNTNIRQVICDSIDELRNFTEKNQAL